jgi:hypothetical protein
MVNSAYKPVSQPASQEVMVSMGFFCRAFSSCQSATLQLDVQGKVSDSGTKLFFLLEQQLTSTTHLVSTKF